MYKCLFVVLTLTTLIIANSCGKKEEPQKTQDTTKNQQLTQQLTEQKTQEQTNTIESKPDTPIKDVKKEEIKKKEVEKQKKEEVKKEEVKIDETPVSTDVIDFSKIWPKKCNKCHGPNGKGKVEGVPDLSGSKTKSKSDKELFKIISNGVKGETDDDEDMPAWKGKLSDEEINAAIKYVKGF